MQGIMWGESDLTGVAVDLVNDGDLMLNWRLVMFSELIAML